ncbi:MFS transporter [Caballeronia sp. GAFFF1]|uniref:MFS transporter n=1 Tax=Caballeronia sp. GAFFF1 TaxID=2921779 RepID=UPI002028FF02|nr:MFS transporter [Caballeronia sp. GAFFF1]
MNRNENSRSTQAPAWLAVLSVALSATVFCTTEFLPVGLLRYISHGLAVNEGAAGMMVSAPGLLAAIAAPAVTVAVRRVDRRRVLQGLGMILVASNLVAMLAPNFLVLVLARALFGIGIGGFWAIGAGLGARLVAERHVGRATSLIFAGVSLGMLIGGPAGALIGELAGWRAAFGAALAMSVVALLIQFAALPELRVVQRIRGRDLLGILATRFGRAGLAAMTLALCGQFATYTYVTPFLATVSGFDGKTISSLLLGYTLIGLFGNFFGGAGAQRDVRTTLLATILFIALPVAALPAIGIHRISAIAALALWGVSYGAMPVALQMWMARATPDMREGGMALFVAVFQISIALGSLAGGLIVDHYGLFDAMYSGSALGVLAMLSIMLFGRPARAATEAAAGS